MQKQCYSPRQRAENAARLRAMPDVVQTRHGATVLMCAPDGPPIADEQSAVDLIGTLWGQDVQWLVLPDMWAE